MRNLQIFNSEQFGQVRTVMINNEPYLVGKDVAVALGYANTRDALLKHVDNDDKADVAIHDGSQNRNMVTINESGVYSLVFGSKLPQAKEFKRWVTKDVLPAIRKTGSYNIPSYQIENPIERAEKWIEEQKLYLVAKPKADAFDVFVDKGHTVGIRDLAKELGVRENDVRQWLIDNEYVYMQAYTSRDGKKKRRMKPYADTVEKGYMTVKDVHQGDFTGTQPRFTMKGKEFFGKQILIAA